MGRSVSVVLITWNSSRDLAGCLEGLLAQTTLDWELIVVDNASEDDSTDVVRRFVPGARILCNGENRGYAPAVNQALELARGELVLLLNPDVRLDPGYLETTAAALRRAGDDFASATGKLLQATPGTLEPTGLVDSRGIRMTRSGRHFDIDAGLPDATESSEPAEVFGVSGAAALHRHAFLEQVAIGGSALDERFFAYREDADLAWRARLFGWRALYVPTAVAYHVRRVSPRVRRSLPPEINMHSVKNRFLLRWKNAGWYLLLRDLPFTLTRDLVVLVATLTIERSSLQAWRWLWQHRAEIRSVRREIQSRRTVSDFELAGWFRW